ncbi:MAG TPA: sigma-70 family RNA polymerase sigma factor [Gemmataceae bacterium]
MLNKQAEVAKTDWSPGYSVREEAKIVKMEPKTAPQTAGMEQWIAEARRGSRAALGQLLAACLPYLLVAARQDLSAELRARVDAADVVQETLIEACRDFARFRGRTEKDLLAWLGQVLRNNLANEHRRHIETAMRNIHCEVPLTEAALNCLRDLARSEGDSPSAQAQARERSEALEQALRRLPEHYRQVLLLHTWEELTFAQVGERLRCSAEAARKLWGRAAEELATVLGDAHTAWQ